MGASPKTDKWPVSRRSAPVAYNADPAADALSSQLVEGATFLVTEFGQVDHMRRRSEG